jgi:hypothetical protein
MFPVKHSLLVCAAALLPLCGTGICAPAASYPGPANYRDFKYHALIIGVDIPPGKNGSGSTCHVPFTAQLSGVLKKWKCFPPGGVITLSGARAGKARIKAALAGLRLGPKDVLLVYYGGHGDWAGIAAGGGKQISPYELFDYMRASRAGFKELLVSACYSGLFAYPDEKWSETPKHEFAVATSGKEDGTTTFGEVGFGPYLLKLLNMKKGSSPAVVTLGEFTGFIKEQNRFWGKKGKTRLSDGRSYGPPDAVLFWN